MSKFKPGDKVLYLGDNSHWTVVATDYDHETYKIELDDGTEPTGICSEKEIRHLTKLERALK